MRAAIVSKRIIAVSRSVSLSLILGLGAFLCSAPGAFFAQPTQSQERCTKAPIPTWP
jgi:hypothetical protein